MSTLNDRNNYYIIIIIYRAVNSLSDVYNFLWKKKTAVNLYVIVQATTAKNTDIMSYYK